MAELTPSQIIEKINAWVNTNGEKQNTGAHLNIILNAIMEYVGVGYAFMGEAPSSAPSPDVPVLYFAGPGSYTGYASSAVDVPDGSIGLFTFNGSAWSPDVIKVVDPISISQNVDTGHTDITIGSITTSVASVQDVSQLGQQITNNGYVDTSGIINSAGAGWRYSNFIPVIAGMKYKLSGYGSNAVSMIAFYDINQNFISGLSGQSATLQKESFNGTIPQDSAFIRLCVNVGGNSEYPYSFLIENYASEEFLDMVLKGRISFDTMVKSFPNSGYFDLNGNVNAALSWVYTDYFIVKPGTAYVVKADHVQNVTPVIVFYNENFDILPNGVVGGSAETGLITYDGIVPEGAIFARTCAKNGNTLADCFVSLELTKDYLLGVISNELHYFANKDAEFKIESFPNDGYFDSDGNIMVTTVWKYTDYILVKPGEPYIAKVEHLKDVTPAIIFYDKDFNILANGIIGVSEESGFITYSGIVPQNARYARTCTKNAQGVLEYSFVDSFLTIDYISSIVVENLLLVSQYDNSILEIQRKIKHFTSFVDKPFSFSGKTAAFFGDSITNGVASDPLRAIENCYRKVLCDTLGLTGTNYAISGSYICDPTDDQESITNRILSQITQSNVFDFIFIMGGTNDFWTGKPLGQLGDATKATFYGSLKVICEHLADTITDATKVVFFVPINCSRYQTSEVAPIESYRQAIYEVASMYGYNVVDTSDICFPDKYMPNDLYWQAMIADGVHPTELGHKILGKNLAAKLL